MRGGTNKRPSGVRAARMVLKRIERVMNDQFMFYHFKLSFRHYA